ncbi:MAG TPA: class C beta-lactamase [Stellaceae bacterium]|nr:class C beta-lactamase [Stellaceae bacterium]
MILLAAGFSVGHAADLPVDRIGPILDRTIRPLMARDEIPGMAIGVIVDGKPHIFDYGVASIATNKPVADGTLFELGSISKTFTATLAAWAAVEGRLSMSDPVAKYLPVLRDKPFGRVRLLDLATHTTGGLPVQVPDEVHNTAQLMDYFQAWHPARPRGTYRTYTNIGIGTLGLITAKSMDQDFATLMQQWLFPALGMKDSYVHLPAAKMADYAQGYTSTGQPIRMAPGVLDDEAYGIRTTIGDMTRFLAANMGLVALDSGLRRAIAATHTGYFTIGDMTQDLIWEQYLYPVTLQSLLDGNGTAMLLKPTLVTAIEPPQAPEADSWINKTGSTNGFSAYIAFVPALRLGIVMLANRNFPIDDQVRAAYTILNALTEP